MLLELPTGGLADSLGRKPVTLLSYAFSLASSVAFLFAFSFPLYLVGFVLMGVGRALSSGALPAWSVDSLLKLEPDTDLQPPLAQAEVFGTLGLTVGTLLGGVVPTLFPGLPADGTAVFTPLAMTFVFAIGLKLVTGWVVVVFVEEDRTRTASDEGSASGVSNLTSVISEALGLTRRNPVLLLLLVGGFASSVGLMSVETFWQPRFAALLGGEPDSLAFGFIMTVGFVMTVLGNLLLLMPTGKLIVFPCL